MPVRSLSSSVLAWPTLREVDRAARDWAGRQSTVRRGALAIGYFGSYARRDHGPGSDLDLVAIVSASDRPFVEPAAAWDLQGLPVPADLIISTANEWTRLQPEGGRFARVLAEETVWVLGSPPHGPR